MAKLSETIAVIIPVYNGAAYLKEALDSVFGQDRPADEVIVVDDGSTDESLAIARGFPHVKCISQVNKGVPTARNVGIEASCTSTIAFLDQDDYWAPEKLNLQISCLQERGDVDYVITQQVFFLNEGVKLPSWLKPEILKRPQPGYVPSALLTRRSLFDRIGFFNPAYPTASDAEWFFRAKDAGIKMEKIPKPLVYKRIHAGNQSNLVQSQHSELLRIARESMYKRCRE